VFRRRHAIGRNAQLLTATRADICHGGDRIYYASGTNDIQVLPLRPNKTVGAIELIWDPAAANHDPVKKAAGATTAGWTIAFADE
jgi:hypothetical protein